MSRRERACGGRGLEQHRVGGGRATHRHDVEIVIGEEGEHVGRLDVDELVAGRDPARDEILSEAGLLFPTDARHRDLHAIARREAQRRGAVVREAEVTGERCTVLAEEAERLDDIDRTAVEGQLQTLRSDLGAAQSDEERSILESRIAIAEAKIEALTTAVYQ